MNSIDVAADQRRRKRAQDRALLPLAFELLAWEQRRNRLLESFEESRLFAAGQLSLLPESTILMWSFARS